MFAFSAGSGFPTHRLRHQPLHRGWLPKGKGKPASGMKARAGEKDFTRSRCTQAAAAAAASTSPLLAVLLALLIFHTCSYSVAASKLVPQGSRHHLMRHEIGALLDRRHSNESNISNVSMPALPVFVGQPTLPATSLEKTVCKNHGGNESGVSGPSPFWKSTTAQAADWRNATSKAVDWKTCLSKATENCLIATGVKWNSTNKSCHCLYGKLNWTDGGSTDSPDFVCEITNTYAGQNCLKGRWQTGTLEGANYTMSALANASTASDCATSALKAGCDAAQMRRGNRSTCACIKLTEKAKGGNAVMIPDAGSTAAGVCLFDQSSLTNTSTSIDAAAAIASFQAVGASLTPMGSRSKPSI
mmetsp:Transcript_70885/g.148283  ORF Transcript_70885/g.148283 Transcript_70885/m.148283 type:complete len:358 (-) Transcript_70885:146-1219(-)